MSQRSLDLINAIVEIAAEANPITVRGIAYRLFVAGQVPTMSVNETKRVSRLVTTARELELLPWEQVVDETRDVERRSSWADPAAYVRTVRRSYRKDFWMYQPRRVEVWAEKGTVRGILSPVLHEYGVGFRVMHGFGSATSVHDAAQDGYEDHPLIALYVGDWDPSGLYMSEVDLPERLARYGGENVFVERIALLAADLPGLPSFAAESKTKDARFKWYVERHGTRCWELDAMHPADLRDRVRVSIEHSIEWDAWKRCVEAQEAEQASLETILDNWVGKST